MAKLTITIPKKGETKIEVTGVSGPTCTASTAPYINAMGQTQSEEQTVEFYQTAEVTETAKN